jgi:hypothetical protein
MAAKEAIRAEETVSEEAVHVGAGGPCGGNQRTHRQVWAAGGRVPVGWKGDGQMLDGLAGRRMKR